MTESDDATMELAVAKSGRDEEIASVKEDNGDDRNDDKLAEAKSGRDEKITSINEEKSDDKMITQAMITQKS